MQKEKLLSTEQKPRLLQRITGAIRNVLEPLLQTDQELRLLQRKIDELTSRNESIKLHRNGNFIEIAVSSENICSVTSRRYHNEGLRKALITIIQNELQQGRHVLYLIIDMRKLKNINDVYGHKYGDMALQTFDKGLERALGSNQYRAQSRELNRSQSGGDEWMGMLSGDEETMKAILADLHTAMNSVPFTFEYEGQTITVSLAAEFGFVVLDPTNISDQIHQLKKALDPNNEDTEEYSVDNFSDVAMLYELTQESGEEQLKRAKEKERYEKLEKIEDKIAEVIPNLMRTGVLQAEGNYPASADAIFSYQEIIQIKQAMTSLVADYMAMRLTPQEAIYYLNIHEFIVNACEHLYKNPWRMSDKEITFLNIAQIHNKFRKLHAGA